MTRRRSLDSSSRRAWSCAGVCPASAARTQESSCRHCQAPVKSAGSPAAAGSARMREVQIGAAADSRCRSSRRRWAAGAISCRSLSSSRRRSHWCRSWRESASANSSHNDDAVGDWAPARSQSRKPRIERVMSWSRIWSQARVQTPESWPRASASAAAGLLIPAAARSVRSCAHVRGQLSARPRSSRARPRTSSGMAAPRSGPPTRASWLRQLVSIRRRRSSRVTAWRHSSMSPAVLGSLPSTSHSCTARLAGPGEHAQLAALGQPVPGLPEPVDE